ncbi:MAG TPA: SOS response-associated peptidase family protein [Gemmataceae bacterium]|jgi:putative SOS response-associated peptidase YedK
MPCCNCRPGTASPPSQREPIIGLKADGHAHGMVPMVREFVPHWSEGDWPAAFINARSETADDSPTFRDACRWHHCLIPALGLYGWSRAGGLKRS